MTLKLRIQDDMKTAMRGKNTLQLTTIRMLLAAIKQYEIDHQEPATDSIMYSIIKKMIKQRRDAAEQYLAAHRNELAAKELQEIDILQSYLPPPLSPAELESAVDDAINSTQATSIKDMGKVMALLKTSLEDRADMAEIGSKVKQRLSSTIAE